MDIHPSGFPGLVGPAGGSDFSHFDFSSHFRILPNTSSSEMNPPNKDSLPIRSHLQPPQMQASPSNSPRFPQTLRLREDNGNNNSSNKAGSPRLAAPSHPLLASDPIPLLNSPPTKRLSHSISSPARVVVEEVKEDEGDFLLTMGDSDNGVLLLLED